MSGRGVSWEGVWVRVGGVVGGGLGSFKDVCLAL